MTVEKKFRVNDMEYTARIWPEDDQYVVECVENGVTSQGDDEEDALRMIAEAVELYLEPDEEVA